MRQVVLRIPLDGPWSLGPLGELPGFGLGIALFAWSLFGGLWLYQHRSQLSLNRELVTSVLIWGAIAAVIVLLPGWTHRGAAQTVVETSATLEKMNRDDPRYHTVYDARDQAWRSQRDFPAAITAYEAEIEKSPQRPEAYKKLAWILVTAPDADVRDAEKALKLAETATELTQSRDAESLDVLAASFAEKGQFEDALKWAKLAAQISATNATNGAADAGELMQIRQRIQLYQREQPYRDQQAGVSMPVFGYGLMLFLGFLFGGWSAIRRARTVGIKKEAIWDVGLWVLIAGIGGARLFYVVQYRDRVFAGKSGLGEYAFALINLREGGLVLYGGVITAFTVFLLYCASRKLKPLLMADVVVPSFFIGLAFGRMGCFLNGCCYGDRCELPWAVSFPLGSVPDMAMVHRGFVGASDFLTLQLHPSQIYSSLNALVLALLTHFYFKIRHRDGAVLGVCLTIYPITRFLIEYLRGDEMGKFSTSLTISQLVSLAMFSVGALYVGWLVKRPVSLTPLMVSNNKTVVST